MKVSRGNHVRCTRAEGLTVEPFFSQVSWAWSSLWLTLLVAQDRDLPSLCSTHRPSTSKSWLFYPLFNSTLSGSLLHYCYHITFRLLSSLISITKQCTNWSSSHPSLTHSPYMPSFLAPHTTAVENCLRFLERKHDFSPPDIALTAPFASNILCSSHIWITPAQTLELSSQKSSAKPCTSPSDLSKGLSYALSWHSYASPNHFVISLLDCFPTRLLQCLVITVFLV